MNDTTATNPYAKVARVEIGENGTSFFGMIRGAEHGICLDRAIELTEHALGIVARAFAHTEHQAWVKAVSDAKQPGGWRELGEVIRFESLMWENAFQAPLNAALMEEDRIRARDAEIKAANQGVECFYDRVL